MQVQRRCCYCGAHGRTSEEAREHAVPPARPAAEAETAEAWEDAAAADDASASAGQRRCFHILGVDLLLDANLRPWLLELNHNPSFTCDTDFDHELKGSVVRAALELLDLQPFNKAQYKEQLMNHMAAKEVTPGEDLLSTAFDHKSLARTSARPGEARPDAARA